MREYGKFAIVALIVVIVYDQLLKAKIFKPKA